MTATNIGANTQRFSAQITNRGSATATIWMEQGKLIHREESGYSSHFLDKEGIEIKLPPGKTYRFPGWLEVTVEDEIRNGQVVARSTRSRSYNGLNDENGEPSFNTIGPGHAVFGQPQVVGAVIPATRVEASLRAIVETGSIPNLQVVLKSEKGINPK